MGVIIGVDIGGTKTHGVRFENGFPVCESIAGSSNVQNVTPEKAVSTLATLFRQLDAQSAAQVWVGAGGVDTAQDADRLAAMVTPLAPNARVSVVHDSRLLLAAGGVNVGVAVISGTGSAVWGRNSRSREARVGGWGYLLGDEGSGYWLGREAVRHSLQRMDEGKHPDLLTELLLQDRCANDPRELIAECYHAGNERDSIAKMARIVITAAERGHLRSRSLLCEAGVQLAQMVLGVTSQLRMKGPVILGGGVGTNSVELQDSFQRVLREQGIDDIRILRDPPVYGVLKLALQAEPPIIHSQTRYETKPGLHH